MRTLVAAAVACTLLGSLTHAQNSEAAVKKNVSIAPQGLSTALQEFAHETKLYLIYAHSDVINLQTGGASGALSQDEALKQLLQGTGLTYRLLDENTITIVPLAAAPAARQQSRISADRTSWSVAQADTTQRASTAGDTDPSTSSEQRANSRIEEVIVTAQKREERLIDVPQSMSVLSAGDLAKLGATQFRDFASMVPGLTSVGTSGQTQITLRGSTVGFDVISMVGIYVDEVPFGSSSAFARGGQQTLDAGLFDIDRIEILRGPQGTLYGSSTMGGLLKYVTPLPDVSRFSVDARTGFSDTHGGEVSYHGAGAVNAPIVTDKMALRASGYYSREGGYLDDIAPHGTDIYGGRADLLLTPTEALSIRITGFLQDTSRDGNGATGKYSLAGDLLDDSLQQEPLTPEPFDQRFELISGTVSYDLGAATATSISSYQTRWNSFTGDLTPSFQFLNGPPYNRSYSSVGATDTTSTDKFTQEVRLTSQGARTVEWLIGAFYVHEKSNLKQEFVARDSAGQLAPNDLFTSAGPSLYEEYAAFGNLTWHLTDKFNVGGGIRYAENDQERTQIGSGLFGSSQPTSRSSDNVFTYLANARYHFSSHATGYVRYATGYRPGGPNFAARNPTTGALIGNPTFEADELRSYEAGFKAETADRHFGIDLAGYYIDWSNIQISVVRGGFSGISNAPGGATIRGAELTLTSRPFAAFTATGAFAYQDARMSEADPPELPSFPNGRDLRNREGERLPNVPRFTGALSVDYELPVGSLRPTVGATVRYVGDRMASFDLSTRPQYRLPDYVTADLRTGFTIDSVDIQLFVRNLFDERGQLAAAVAGNVATVTILQPRTIGIGLVTHF